MAKTPEKTREEYARERFSDPGTFSVIRFEDDAPPPLSSEELQELSARIVAMEDPALKRDALEQMELGHYDLVKALIDQDANGP